MFTGSVGIDDEIGDRGSTVFEIHVDGEPRWRSEVMTGEGPAKTFRIDVADKRYLDLISGIGVNALGHAHPQILRVLKEQAGLLVL